MNVKILCATSLALAFMSAALADTPIYKWVDDQGQVHYSTVPHSDKAQQLGIQNTATPHAGTGVTPIPGASTSPAANDVTLVHPQAADSPECRAGRDRLFRYLHADKLYRTDEKGKKTTLSEADKQQAIQESRDYVKQACGGGT